jgi:hypothetical protein
MTDKIKTVGNINQPPMPPPENIQQTALNGAQVDSFVHVIEAVQRQTMPPDTAKAMIQAAFPTIPLPVIDAMFAPLGVAPTPPPPDQMPPDQSAIPPEAPQPEPNLTI